MNRGAQDKQTGGVYVSIKYWYWGSPSLAAYSVIDIQLFNFVNLGDIAPTFSNLKDFLILIFNRE